MQQPLRKSLVLAVCGQEIAVEIDFRFIETMERVFGQSADMLIPLFIDVGQVQRRHTADVIAELIGRKVGVELKRAEVREFVITATADEYFVLATQLQLALLFILRHMPGENFDQGVESLKGSKKKPEAPPGS